MQLLRHVAPEARGVRKRWRHIMRAMLRETYPWLDAMPSFMDHYLCLLHRGAFRTYGNSPRLVPAQ